MDNSWANIHAHNLDFADQLASQDTTDTAASYDDLSDMGTRSNSDSGAEAARKARQKAHRDRNRQKEADKRKLLDFKVRVIRYTHHLRICAYPRLVKKAMVMRHRHVGH